MIRSLVLHRAYHKNTLSSHDSCPHIYSGSVFGMNNLFTEALDSQVQLLRWQRLCPGELLHSPPHCMYIIHPMYGTQHFTSSNSWDSRILQSEDHWEADKEKEVDFVHLKSLLNQCWTRECSSVSHMPPCGFQRADFLFCFRNESFSNQQAIIWIGTWWIPAADFTNL